MIATQFFQLDKAAAKGLCIEFILHEYAKALAIASRLESASAPNLLADLEKLTADQGGCQFQQPGVLDKLCFYCEVLVQTTKIGEELLDAIEELRASLTVQRAKVSRRLRSHRDLDAISLSPAVVQSTQKHLRVFFALLIPYIHAAVDCETALFSLVELRTAINAHLGSGTIENLLHQLFPAGLAELRQAICHGFERRGFADYSARHQALFEGLTWPVPSSQKL